MNIQTKQVSYLPLSEGHFAQVITLANQVHGDGYLDTSTLKEWLAKGMQSEINSSFVALVGNKLIGFRITFAAKQWLVDKWCTPPRWQVNQAQCCYFKCNTVDKDYRGSGVGKQLLTLSINAVKKQGALAGVSHLWRESPNNSAVLYFTRCGGQLVRYHKDKWHEDSKNGYKCILCGHDCHCEAAEMIIYFN